MKEKVLQLENEKEILQKEKELTLKAVSTEQLQQTTIDELTKPMSQVVLRMMKVKISKRRIIKMIKKIKY